MCTCLEGEVVGGVGAGVSGGEQSSTNKKKKRSQGGGVVKLSITSPSGEQSLKP